MTPDFIIRLTLATHKVADILPKQDLLGVQIKDSANKLLASLVLLTQTNPITTEQKKSITPKAIRDIGVLIAFLNYAKRMSKLNPAPLLQKNGARVNPENFLVLEQEYNKVGDFLRQLHQNDSSQNNAEPFDIAQGRQYAEPRGSVRRPASNIQEEQAAPKRDLGTPKPSLSTRQTRILELIRNKDKTQVWELQKVLPEVTKRTLRRDLDDLLQRQLIIRQGEWNEVFYQIR